MSTEKKRLTEQAEINASREKVFNFVTQFGTWPQWYPLTVSVKGDIDHPANPGDKCEEHIAIYWIFRFKLYWTVKEKRFPEYFSYEGSSNAGGDAFIQYTFEERDGKTVFTRILEYKQTNPFYRFLNRLFIGEAINRASTQALNNVTKILEASDAGHEQKPI